MEYTAHSGNFIQNFNPASTVAPPDSGDPSVCGAFSYTVTGSLISTPSGPGSPLIDPVNDLTTFITITSGVMTVNAVRQNRGVYDVVMHATLVDFPLVPEGTKSFRITVFDPCLETDLSFGSQVLQTMTSEIAQASATQTVTAPTNSISELKADVNLCGKYTYTLTPSHPFLTIDQTTRVMTLASSDMTKSGTYPMTLSVFLTEYPARGTLTKSFTAVLVNPCLTATLTLPTTLTGSSITAYSGTAVTQTFMPATDNKADYSETPGLCGPRVYVIDEILPAEFTSIIAPSAG